MFKLSRSSPPAKAEPDLAVVVPLLKEIRQARAGDSAAFYTLFQYYTTRICTYLARMVGNDEEGRDLAQETFLKAWRMLPTIQDETRFGPWLYRIATNLAIDHLRGRKPPSFVLDQELASASSYLGTMEGRVAEVEHIQAALTKVSPKYRACLLLQIEGGFSQREIADLLSLSIKSVSVYVKCGCEQFRRAYEEIDQGHESQSSRKGMTLL